MVRCKCGENKRLYRSYQEAKAAMLDSGLEIYRCPAVNGWHLTSKRLRETAEYKNEDIEEFDEERLVYLQMKSNSRQKAYKSKTRISPIKKLKHFFKNR